jgi:hypothetical protein
MRRLLLAAILMLTAPPAGAADRAETIEALLEAQGVYDLWQRRLIIERAENEALAHRALEQILVRIDPDETFMQQAEFAVSEFIAKAQNLWTVDEIVDAWGRIYARDFTDDELVRLLDFYASELGQKEVEASRAASLELTRRFQAKAEPIRRQALEELILDLQKAAREYRRRSAAD